MRLKCAPTYQPSYIIFGTFCLSLSIFSTEYKPTSNICMHGDISGKYESGKDYHAPWHKKPPFSQNFWSQHKNIFHTYEFSDNPSIWIDECIDIVELPQQNPWSNSIVTENEKGTNVRLWIWKKKKNKKK